LPFGKSGSAGGAETGQGTSGQCTELPIYRIVKERIGGEWPPNYVTPVHVVCFAGRGGFFGIFGKSCSATVRRRSPSRSRPPQIGHTLPKVSPLVRGTGTVGRPATTNGSGLKGCHQV